MNAQRIRTEEQHRSYADLVDGIALRADREAVAFRRIRARLDEIRHWFIEYPGWPVIEARDIIRVVKTPSGPDASQGLAWCESTLDYELLTWLLRYEETLESPQFVCSELVQNIERDIREVVGVGHFSWDVSAHRRSLSRVVIALTDMGALRRLDGSIEDYASGREDGLYEFTGLARHLYVRVPHDLDQADDPLDVVRDAVTNADTPPLQRLYRALLLKSALYEHHDPDAFRLLRRPDVREQVADNIADRFGWDLEVAGSYAALLRPAALNSRAAFPRANAGILHVVLLMCGSIRLLVQGGEIVPDAQDVVTMSMGRFISELLELREEYGMNWGKTLSPDSDVSISELADRTLAVMREWGLAERSEDAALIRILPLCARFIAAYTDEPIASFESAEDDDS